MFNGYKVNKRKKEEGNFAIFTLEDDGYSSVGYLKDGEWKVPVLRRMEEAYRRGFGVARRTN